LNLLDENFPDDQQLLLRKYKIPFRQIGKQAGYLGIKDDNIVPLLHRSGSVTFFTLDRDFFRRELCHIGYCVVWLNVRADDAAHFVRLFLRHRSFDTHARRLGHVVRAHDKALSFWRLNVSGIQNVHW
jgi:hypothetical protein